MPVTEAPHTNKQAQLLGISSSRTSGARPLRLHSAALRLVGPPVRLAAGLAAVAHRAAAAAAAQATRCAAAGGGADARGGRAGVARWRCCKRCGRCSALSSRQPGSSRASCHSCQVLSNFCCLWVRQAIICRRSRGAEQLGKCSSSSVKTVIARAFQRLLQSWQQPCC